MSATTAATISPAKRTTPEAITGRRIASAAAPAGIGPSGSVSAVYTPATPGAAAAAAVSIEAIRAWANSERTKATYFAPGSGRSSV